MFHCFFYIDAETAVNTIYKVTILLKAEIVSVFDFQLIKDFPRCHCSKEGQGTNRPRDIALVGYPKSLAFFYICLPYLKD